MAVESDCRGLIEREKRREGQRDKSDEEGLVRD